MANPRPGAELAGRNPGGRTQPKDRQMDSTPEAGWFTDPLRSGSSPDREDSEAASCYLALGDSDVLALNFKQLPNGCP